MKIGPHGSHWLHSMHLILLNMMSLIVASESTSSSISSFFGIAGSPLKETMPRQSGGLQIASGSNTAIAPQPSNRSTRFGLPRDGG
jgi:hypothetical protein